MTYTVQLTDEQLDKLFAFHRYLDKRVERKRNDQTIGEWFVIDNVFRTLGIDDLYAEKYDKED